MDMPVNNFTGFRVLLVEDQLVVAMQIEDMLHGLGCVVVGPVGTLESAVPLARKEAFDAAILDVSLDGEKVFPVAEELHMRGIPFAFATGYGEASLPEKWRRLHRLAKPFGREQLEECIRSLCGR